MKTKVVRGSAPGKPEQVQPLHYILWTSGGIQFDGVPMYRVIRDLERQSNVEITTSNTSLLEIPYTATFHHASLNEIREVSGTTLKMGIRSHGAGLEFYQKSRLPKTLEVWHLPVNHKSAFDIGGDEKRLRSQL